MSTSMANRILRAAAPLILCGSCALTGGCKSLGLSQPETVTSEQVLGKLDATEKATPPPAPEIVALPAPQPAPQPMLAPPAPAPAPRPAFTTAPAGFAEEAETSVPATVARAPAPRHQGSSSRSSGHVAATAQGGGKTHVVQVDEDLRGEQGEDQARRPHRGRHEDRDSLAPHPFPGFLRRTGGPSDRAARAHLRRSPPPPRF
jgi:hypothetical protein